MKFVADRGFERLLLCHVLAVLLAFPPYVVAQEPPAAPQQAKPMANLPIERSLKVIPLAGNGEMNDLERRIMAPVVVQVLDQSDRPIEGAEVVFRFPLTGPGAVFAGQKNSKTTRTNGQGEAAATGWSANSELGTFPIRVTATYGHQMGETTISMTNVTRVVDEPRAKRKSWRSSPWFKVALVAGAAGLVTGIVLATRGGSNSSGTPITITPGNPGVGGPQ